MGFYGNVKNTSRTQFYFDRVYPSRKSMEDNKTRDNIFAGRYVLVEYETDISEDDFQSYYMIDGELFTEVVTYEATAVLDSNRTMNIVSRGLESSKLNNEDVYDGQIITVPAGGQIRHTASTDVYIRFTDSRGSYVAATKEAYDSYYAMYPQEDPQIAIVDNAMYSIGAFQTGQYAKLLAANIYSTTAGQQYFQATVSGTRVTWSLLASDGSNFVFNQGIDKAAYGNDRSYDSTVWQKIYDGSEEKYILIAELNTLKPIFSFTADAPTTTPIPIHYDPQNTNLSYNIHMQTPWGIRTRSSKPLLVPMIDSNGVISSTLPSVSASSSNVVYPSDESTVWRGDFYDLSTEDKDTKFYSPITYRWNGKEGNVSSSVPAAIYFNKKGFDPDKIHRSEFIVQEDDPDYVEGITADVIKDKIGLEPTGYSGRVYNSHKASDTYEVDVDTQEFVCMLPSIGDTMSDIWDLVYGDETVNPNLVRNKLMEWEYANEVVKREGLRALKEDELGGFSGLSEGVNTLAGSVNSVYDLMGQIIVKDSDNLDMSKYENTFIYHFKDEGVFKRKAVGYDYTEVTYNYEEISLTPESYSPKEYYTSTNGTDFIICEDAEFDNAKTYYIKKTPFKSEYTPIELAEPPEYLIYYKTPSGDYRYTPDMSEDIEYYRFISRTEIRITDRYTPYTFFYLNEDGTSYVLDTEEEATKGRSYFTLDGVQKLNQSVENPALYDTNTNLYQIGTNPDGTPIRVPLKYVYCPNYFYKMYEEDGVARLTPENRDYNVIDLTENYYIVRGSIVGGDDDTNVWVPDGEGGFIASTPTGSLQIEGMYKVELLPFIPEHYYVQNGVVRIPTDEDDFEFDDDIVVQEAATGAAATSVVAQYDILTLESLQKIYEDEFNYAGNAVPIFTDLNSLELNAVGTFYESNRFYYQTSDGSYVIDTNENATDDRQYFSSLSFESVEGYRFYIPNKYYYYDTNVEQYILDKTIEFDPNKTYYVWNGKLYVLEDAMNMFAKYSTWNMSVEQIPASVKLASREERIEMKTIPMLGRKLNTMNGLILKINQLLEIDNFETRDRETVQGSINALNDIINKFEELQPRKILIGDSYGRVNSSDWSTAQASSSTLVKTNADLLEKDNSQDRFAAVGSVDEMRGQWLTLQVNGNPTAPLITVHHNFQPVNDTTSATNKNTNNVASNNASDKISLYTPIVDAMGHVVGKNTETVTLPYGFKTIGTNGSSTAVTELSVSSSDIVAETTQDRFGLNTGNKWLRIQTNPSTDVLTVAHTLSTASAQANADFGLSFDDTLNLLESDNSFDVPVLSFDEAGHIIKAETHTITIPQISTSGINLSSTSGQLVTSLALNGSTLQATRQNLGNLTITGYAGPYWAYDTAANIIPSTQDLTLSEEDTLNDTISKIETHLNRLDYNAITLETNIRYGSETLTMNQLIDKISELEERIAVLEA